MIHIGGTGNLFGVKTTAFNINGGTGSDSLTIDNHLSTDNAGYTFASGKMVSSQTQKWVITNLEQVSLQAGSGNNWVNAFSASQSMYITTQGGNDTVLGSPYDDGIYTGDSDDQVFGNGGNDLLEAGLGNDYISGGAGIDTVSYGDRLVQVKVDLSKPSGNGQAGESDQIQSDVEAIEGGEGNDLLKLAPNRAGLLYGNGGNDTLYGSKQSDYLFGGAGNDTLYMQDSVTDYYDPGSGTNTIHKDSIDIKIV